jgi:hypothetical protein
MTSLAFILGVPLALPQAPDRAAELVGRGVIGGMLTATSWPRS